MEDSSDFRKLSLTTLALSEIGYSKA